MHTWDKISSRELVKERSVQILRGLVVLCGFAAVGFVLFGRSTTAIILAVAIGSVWLGLEMRLSK